MLSRKHASTRSVEHKLTDRQALLEWARTFCGGLAKQLTAFVPGRHLSLVGKQRNSSCWGGS